ncbi:MULTISPECIES: DUF6745 domain-containing protein [unclassified Nodularia (in: cyanobacteria)]|uniref:DUF6745 domain-containing protein n=2 Tax=unclassified Nodularia (in: cyanobacteria) TaxID=2656917 RepID=UPI001880B87A|nr:hypothetical protein [Nodularia sp. LEGE 04288]MBE9198220.1 hypothetical protein [Nodularia sp. LEGE 06071]MCC2693022.1 hypothetical protein [Nodularia sp. LEGE 04288]
MLNMMSKGRIPKKPVKQRPSDEPVSPEVARKLILSHRAWDGMRVLGHLNLSGASDIYNLPENLTCESLDISDCVNLTTLPQGLHVTHGIELANSGITSLPAGHGFVLRWRGVEVNDQMAFASDSITGQDILNIENVELRRVLIERLGYETLLQQVGGLIRDRDQDAGGERQLVYIPFEDDEPFMVLKVTCPSTGHIHILRVPPHMRNCHQAAAWIAGFNNPDDYHPLIEA